MGYATLIRNATIRRTGKRSGRLRGRMSTCTDEADNAPLHMQEALSPVSHYFFFYFLSYNFKINRTESYSINLIKKT